MQEPITLHCNQFARVTGAPFAALLVRMRWGGFEFLTCIVPYRVAF
jgi:hypothetical protein